MATFPPSVPSAVWIPHFTAQISAPPNLVFDLLTDLDTYPDWNEWIPRVDAPKGQPRRRRIETGMKMILRVRMPFLFGIKMPYSTTVEVALLELPGDNRRDTGANTGSEGAAASGPDPSATASTAATDNADNAAAAAALAAGARVWKVEWVVADTPRSIFRARRHNEVIELPDGSCIYRTYEVMEGPMAYLVKFFSGSGVQSGFRTWAHGLKDRAEHLHADAPN